MRMRLLVIDSCDDPATMVLAEEGRLVAQARVEGRRSAEGLLPGLRRMLDEAGWAAVELGAIGVVRGPGSFTGVRVGLSAGKGLSEGLGVPLVAVSRFAVMLAAAGERRGVGLLAAGRGEFFWGRMDEGGDEEHGLATAEEILTGVLQAGEMAVCMEAARGALAGLSGVRGLAEAGAAEAVAPVMERLRRGQVGDVALLDALYIRRTEQELLDRQREHGRRLGGG